MSPPRGRRKAGSLPHGGTARSAKGAPICPPPGRPKAGSALQAAASRDATPPRSLHARAGGHGAADLGPHGGTARSAKGAPIAFSASWLALREPHDHAARAVALTDRLCSFLRTRKATGTIRILDLACGSGSTFRYLASRIDGAQHWLMVDNDDALLTLLPGLPRQGELANVEAVCLDLATGLARLPLQGVDLMTASALLDLVSADWLDALVAAVSVERPALLLALSYDGSMNWQPALVDDPWVAALFNRHQLIDKGFGPALGPTAAWEAIRRLRSAGFTVIQADSAWRIGCRHQAMQRELAGGMAAALAADITDDTARLRHWLDRRLELIDAGQSALQVGHTDLLALPVSSGC